MNQHWHIIEVTSGRELSLHDVLCKPSKKGKDDALVVWTATREKTMLLKSRLTRAERKARKRPQSVTYDIPLYSGYMWVQTPTLAAQARLQKIIDRPSDVRDYLKDRLKDGSPRCVMTEEARLSLVNELMSIKREGRKPNLDIRDQWKAKYQTAKPHGYNPETDSKKNRQKKYSQGEYSLPDIQDGDEVVAISGPLIGITMTVRGEIRPDHTVNLEGLVLGGLTKVKANAFDLKKAS